MASPLLIPLLAAGARVAGGLLQSGLSGQRKKEAELMNQANNQPKYSDSTDFDQYYQQSRALANTAAQNTALYKMQQQQADRAMAAGLQSANLGGMGGQGYAAKLAQQNIDASARNLASAEQLKEQRMGRWGAAAGQKMGENRYKFQTNQMQPWETRYNLLAARAAQAARQNQAGLQNIYGGLGDAASAWSTNEYYKNAAKAAKKSGSGISDLDVLSTMM